MWASHPGGTEETWFGFRIRKNGILLTDSLASYTVLSDDLFDSGYLPGFPVGFLSDDDPQGEGISGGYGQSSNWRALTRPITILSPMRSWSS
jgi:hypothetical protein